MDRVSIRLHAAMTLLDLPRYILYLYNIPTSNSSLCAVSGFLTICMENAYRGIAVAIAFNLHRIYVLGARKSSENLLWGGVLVMPLLYSLVPWGRITIPSLV